MMYFAIRKIGTDDYIPQSRTKATTWNEPMSLLAHPPRLWNRRYHANSYLTVWCKGAAQREWSEAKNGYIVKIDPVTKRDRSLYEVIALEITESQWQKGQDHD